MSTRKLTNLHARPGGRTAATTHRIHDAVIALLAAGGHEQVTFQNVARRAEVERSTLYRRYPNRWAMLGEAYAAKFASQLVVRPGHSFARDLKAHLMNVAATLGSALGGAMLVAAAVARLDPTTAPTAGRFWEFRLRQQEAFVAAAIARGELPADVDRELLFAVADGPLYFRLLVVGRPIDEAFVDTVVADVCARYRCNPSGE